ncbi:pseudouridine synthase [Roseibium sp. M-1]
MTTRKSSERPGPAKGRGRDSRAPEKRRSAPNGAPKKGPRKAAPERSGPKPAPARVADDAPERGERIAKVMARVGLCSRRDAETWIENGRVELNGKVLTTPAVTVTPDDKVLVDGEPLPLRERTRLWLYHKPRGLVTTNKDPEGRSTVFDRLPEDLPRVLTVGRLDINTEGLLLLTNDGGLARVLELPATGWLRRYRVRAFGKVTQADLDGLKDGVAIDGVLYGSIEVTLDKEQGGNVWMTVGLREGKNREVKRVLEHIGLAVNRLIRVSYGPFQLMDLPEGDVREIRGRVLRDQLGDTLAEEAGADFDAPIFHMPKEEPQRKSAPAKRAGGKPGGRSDDGRETSLGRWMSTREGQSETDRRRAAKTERNEQRQERKKTAGDRPRKNAGPRQEKVSPRSRFRLTSEPRPRREFGDDRPAPPQRKIWGEEGIVEDKQQENRTGRDKPARGRPAGGKSFGDRPGGGKSFGERSGGDRPRGERPRRDGPREDRPRQDGPRQDGPRDDRPREFKPRGDRPRGDGPRDFKSRGDRPNRERSGDDRPSRGGFGRDGSGRSGPGRDGGDRRGPPKGGRGPRRGDRS